jgi:hypothetical protein
MRRSPASLYHTAAGQIGSTPFICCHADLDWCCLHKSASSAAQSRINSLLRAAKAGTFEATMIDRVDWAVRHEGAPWPFLYVGLMDDRSARGLEMRGNGLGGTRSTVQGPRGNPTAGSHLAIWPTRSHFQNSEQISRPRLFGSIAPRLIRRFQSRPLGSLRYTGDGEDLCEPLQPRKRESLRWHRGSQNGPPI